MLAYVLSILCGALLGITISLVGIRKNFNTLREAITKRSTPQKVSVIIASRNEEDVIEETIRSVARSATTEAEIIVVDASNDRTPEILARLQKQIANLLVVPDPERTGKATALNLALSYATGDIVLILDADARLDSEFFHFYSSLVAHPDNPVVFADYVSYNRRRIPVIFQEVFSAISKSFFYSGIFGPPTFMSSGLFIQRDVLNRVSYFDVNTLVDDFFLANELAKLKIYAKFVRGPRLMIQYAPGILEFFRQCLRIYTGLIREIFKRIGKGELSYLGAVILLGSIIYLPQIIVILDMVIGRWELTPRVLPGFFSSFYFATLVSYVFEGPPFHEAIMNGLIGIPCAYLWVQIVTFIAFFKALSRRQNWYKTPREKVGLT